MKSKIDEILERKQNAHNCAQAIVCAYADELNIDEKVLYRMAQGFGKGNGNMEGTCGAISGAQLVIGLLFKDESKIRSNSMSLIEQFQSKNSTVICKELKGIGKDKPLRKCIDCVKDASEILEEILNKDLR